MSEVKTLLWLELRSLFGTNKVLHTKDKKEKSRYKTLIVAWVILIVMAVVYVSSLVNGLCAVGLSNAVPAYLAVVSGLLILMFSLFSAGNRIFGQKGYDILISMPIKPISVVISRFLCLYAADFVFAAVIMITGIVSYGMYVKPDASFYIISAVGTLFIPVIPLVISLLFGTLVMAVSARMKSKSAVQTFLMLVLVLGVMFISFSTEGADTLSPEQLTTLAQAVLGVIEKIYFPAVWFNKAAVNGEILYLFLFAVLSLAIMAVAIFISSKCFNYIIRHLQSFSAKNNYKIGEMKSRSILKALYVREAKRYFSSSIYVTNTIIGPIMGTVLSIVLCISGIDTITTALPLPIPVAYIVPLVLAGVFCMMTTTSTSISMEGKQVWIVKSLPVAAKTLYDSKILFNLTLILPFYLTSTVLTVIAVTPTLLQLVWLVVIPASVILFAVVFGITVNIKSHSFDWEREEAVVKQSFSSMFGGFAGFFTCLLFLLALLLTPAKYSDLLMGFLCIALWAATTALYGYNNKKSLTDL